MRHRWGPSVAIALRGTVFLIWPASVAFSQNPPPAGNAVVKYDNLQVHSEANDSSNVVQTLKKGDALNLGIQIRAANANWCSVRLPGQSVRLGYVQCLGIEVKESEASAGNASGPEGGADVAAGGSANGARPPVHLSIGRPSAPSSTEYGRIAAEVVHGGMLDGRKVSDFDRAAEGGGQAAMIRAAWAHYAAGDFELDHGDSDSAVEQYRAALPYAEQQPNLLFSILLRLAYIHLRRSEFSTALAYLERIQKIQANSPIVLQMMGEAYYGLNRIDDAIKVWRTAQSISRSGEVAELLERAERDSAAEAGARSNETSHFVLRYQGSATPQLAAEVLSTLEEHFNSLRTALDFTPVEPIGVVLYTQQSFRDITMAPSWAGALNDGRLRIPVEGLTNVTPDLSRILKHELTHSFVFQMTLGRCPTWLNEGIAQWMEGKRSNESAKFLLTIYDRKQHIPFERLAGPWNGFPTQLAVYAYAWSLAAAEFIISKSGPWGISRLFANLNSASSFENAMTAALQISYADLDRETADYLRKTYAQ